MFCNTRLSAPRMTEWAIFVCVGGVILQCLCHKKKKKDIRRCPNHRASRREAKTQESSPVRFQISPDRELIHPQKRFIARRLLHTALTIVIFVYIVRAVAVKHRDLRGEHRCANFIFSGLKLFPLGEGCCLEVAMYQRRFEATEIGSSVG